MPRIICVPSTTSDNILTACSQLRNFILTSAFLDTPGTNYCRSDFPGSRFGDEHLHIGNFLENILRINTLKDMKEQNWTEGEGRVLKHSQQFSANPRWTTGAWTDLKDNPESRQGGWLDSYTFTTHWRLTALRKVCVGDPGWKQLFTKVSSQRERTMEPQCEDMV